MFRHHLTHPSKGREKEVGKEDGEKKKKKQTKNHPKPTSITRLLCDGFHISLEKYTVISGKQPGCNARPQRTLCLSINGL